MRPDPFAACFKHPFLRRIQQGLLRIGQFRFDNAQNVLVRERIGVAVIDEIALLGDAEVAGGDLKFVRLQQFRQLARVNKTHRYIYPRCSIRQSRLVPLNLP